jgi:hypothetical protein
VDTVNEGSTCVVTASFADETGAAVTPSSVRYRITDDTSRTVVAGWTSLSVSGPSVDIEITPAQNAIIGASAAERRTVTVECTYGSGRKAVAEYRYVLKNLQALP